MDSSNDKWGRTRACFCDKGLFGYIKQDVTREKLGISWDRGDL
jgi:hypothetical protein